MHPAIRGEPTFRKKDAKKSFSNHCKGGTQMKNSMFPNGKMQSFYYEDDHPTIPGWFKGMEQIICEHNLWPATGLQAQCEGFKCVPRKTNCCCHRLLFTQPDFVT
jgi:hypothetical protein